MKAVILAGGKGERLRPVTYEIPKPLITVKKKPILNHLIEFLSRYGVTDIAIIIPTDQVGDYDRWQKVWADDLPATPEIFTESRPVGTFAALYAVKDWVGGDDFISINGDSLFDFDLVELLAFHSRHQLAVSAALLASQTAGHYIVPELLADGMIVGQSRQAVPAQSADICCGLYIFRPTIFTYGHPDREILQIEADIFPGLIETGQLIGKKLTGRFFDCGTLASWEQAIKEW